MADTKLIESYKRKLIKALGHLDYSFKKAQLLNPKATDEESLETWESFVARFARVIDMFLTKYLKARILHDDPAFDGSLRDFCNRAEKLKLIDDVEAWIARRELRNAAAHEYEEDDLAAFFKRVLAETPEVIRLKSRL